MSNYVFEFILHNSTFFGKLKIMMHKREVTKMFIAHIREQDNKIQTVEEHSKQTKKEWKELDIDKIKKEWCNH